MEDAVSEKKDQIEDWLNLTIPEEVMALVQFDSIARYKFIPFRIMEEAIDVAILDETDIDTQNALQFFARKNGKKINHFKINQENFDILLKKFKNPTVEIGRALEDFEEKQDLDNISLSANKTKQKDSEVLSDAPVAKMLEVILKNAIDGRASDIHIEPMDENVRVRYRVDGILYSSISLPKKVGPAIVSRIKILSNLKIDEKRKPQDGRFRINDLGNAIDFRVSTFPISNGEKVAMRILDKKTGLIGLEELGLLPNDFKLLKRIIKEPYGIILVTGPTGSGKSTTLYSILKLLNKEGVNIVTLEDPIEYVLEGVGQSQVRPEIGYNFSSGLRSVLRQDPDIIMVGEIRDVETAELAIHAALTGHLVFSTLHTNTAIGAIARLIDMGIQPFLIASALKLIIGQRLVRKICPECKHKTTDFPDETMRMIKKELEKINGEVKKELGVNSEDIIFYEAEGCSKCQNKGMKGRLGVYEFLEVTPSVAKLIGNRSSDVKIEEKARLDGYTTMKQDGILKVLKGQTTLEEIQRVTEDQDEEEVIQAKGE